MNARNNTADWLVQPNAAMALAALTVAMALLASFILVVQGGVQRGADRRMQMAVETPQSLQAAPRIGSSQQVAQAQQITQR